MKPHQYEFQTALSSIMIQNKQKVLYDNVHDNIDILGFYLNSIIIVAADKFLKLNFPQKKLQPKTFK